MRKIELGSGSSLTAEEIRQRLATITKTTPIKGENGFSNIKAIETAIDAGNGTVELRDDDYAYLVDRFKWALEHDQLIGRANWEDVWEVVQSAEKISDKQTNRKESTK
jgi:hypothetical protein